MCVTFRRRARRNRFFLYVAVMTVRTLVLYLGLGYVQVGGVGRISEARKVKIGLVNVQVL